MTGKYLKLNRPKGQLTQGFAKNANPYYKGVGLKGHTGEDYIIGWKQPIEAVVSGEVYSTLNFRNSDTEAYRAVYQIVDTTEFSYEVSYGHLDSTPVSKGQFIKQGEVIGYEGNYGMCYSGGKRVTPAQKKTGRGSHLHFQVRKCKRVKSRERGKEYLRDSAKYLKRDGYYYEVVDYDNGYNGCVSPSLFYELSLSLVIRILKMLGIIK